MAGVSNHAAGWRWATLAAALLGLNVLLTFRNLWPTPAVRWNGDLSIEVAVCMLVMVLASRRSRPPSRIVLRFLSILGVLLVLCRYADVTSSGLYGRGVNLYWDVRHVPNVAAMLASPASRWLVLVVVGAAVLIPLILYVVLRIAFGRIGDAMGHPRERRALGLLAAAVILLFAAQRIDARLPSVPRFSTPVTWTLAKQARLVASELTRARAGEIGPGASFQSDLAGVLGADVFVIFMESYGAVSYDQPEFAASLAPGRAQLEADIHATGRDVVSAFVESPTFGGSSWLAHISLLSGVEVRDEDTSVRLMAQKRDTLVTMFGRHGYRTVAIMPGLQEAWPEGAFYGFDDIYDEARLDYHGPPFGWWSLPDQFAIARLDTLEVSKRSRAPIFVFFPTTNTHTPFSPTPPYQPDWRRVLTEQPYDAAELQYAWEQQPDWLNMGPSFVHALAAGYQSLGGYLRLRADRDFVMILLGDHQPPAVVSGEGASWEVPVHVIASRRGLLDRLVAHGFRPGLAPQHPAIARMHALVPILLAAFDGGT
jgi:Sulfatase